jgi:hypothetical protein
MLGVVAGTVIALAGLPAGAQSPAIVSDHSPDSSKMTGGPSRHAGTVAPEDQPGNPPRQHKAPEPKVATPPRRWTFGAWFASGTHQMIKTRMGHRYDRSLYLTAIRAERPVHVNGRFTLSYTADVHPLIIATANREYAMEPLCILGLPCTYPANAEENITSRHTAYGFGLVPVGLHAQVGIGGPFALSFAASGGGAYFNRRIPDPGETRFNFTADGNVGLSVKTGLGALTAGWRQHHISNGYTGRVNPALDSRLMFVGFMR